MAMSVTVTNPHAQAVTLDSIDVSKSFLSGFQVVAVDPAPTETYDIPFTDQRSWTFNHEVLPEQSLSINFELKAVQAGHFSGEIDVCNPNQDFRTLYADVLVLDREPSNQ